MIIQKFANYYFVTNKCSDILFFFFREMIMIVMLFSMAYDIIIKNKTFYLHWNGCSLFTMHIQQRNEMNKRHSNAMYINGIVSKRNKVPKHRNQMKNRLQLNLWASSVLSFMKTIFLNWVFIRSCLSWCQNHSEIVYVLVFSYSTGLQLALRNCKVQSRSANRYELPDSCNNDKTKMQSPIKYTRKLDCFRLITNYLTVREMKLRPEHEQWMDRDGHKKTAINDVATKIKIKMFVY